jgi:membrane dipeptidase
VNRIYSRIAAAALILSVGAAASGAANGDDTTARLERVLAATPLIDGHNDLPWELRSRSKGRLSSIDLALDTSQIPPPAGEVALMTDIPRLKAGHVGGQFWSVWIPATTRGFEAVQVTMEQIDLVKRLVALYPADLEMAYTAADIRRIHHAHRVASLIGIEGGHQINNSLAVLRQMYELGARYMTLTHALTTDWADSATDAPKYHGLTPFGVEVIHEMNRIGMLVDLSHVSADTMRMALQESAAPVIYSHSSARALVDHPRNVPDDVLRLVGAKSGIVMVNFASGYDSDEVRHWDADRAAENARNNTPPFDGLYIGQPDQAKAALDAWEASHPQPRATLSQVADHAEHIRMIAGIDHVGLGSDFDGISNTPIGLEAVDKFPALLRELMRRGWSDQDIAKIAGENVLRVMSEAEKVAARLRTERAPSEAVIETLGSQH